MELQSVQLCECDDPEVGGDGRKRYTCRNCGHVSPWFPENSVRLVRNCRRGPLTPGPGAMLKALLLSLDIDMAGDCGCEAHAAQMDYWGVSGCLARRAEIVGWLQEAADRKGWAAKIRAGWKMKDEAWFNVLDPIGSMVDEAIRRAEAKIP